jgi:hypothetical protein
MQFESNKKPFINDEFRERFPKLTFIIENDIEIPLNKILRENQKLNSAIKAV